MVANDLQEISDGQKLQMFREKIFSKQSAISHCKESGLFIKHSPLHKSQKTTITAVCDAMIVLLSDLQ